MSSLPLFHNRQDAGEQLAVAVQRELSQMAESGLSAPQIVYGLPRGGIPVAAPVARWLGCPLDVVVAKKISHPKNPELAIGAVSADGQVLWASNSMPPLFLRQRHRQREEARDIALEKAQLQQAQFAPACPLISTKGAIAILVDDGIATGMTMAVAASALKVQQPAAIWLCAPVAPASLMPWLEQWGDRTIVLETPDKFFSVSSFYSEFPQVKTEEALTCLQQQNEQWLANR